MPLLCAIAARLLAFEKKNATLKKRSVMNTPKAVVCMAGASYHRLWALSATDDSRVQAGLDRMEGEDEKPLRKALFHRAV